MRRLIALQILFLVTNVWAADVTIYCTADGNVVTVSYTASAEANIPRAFALDIQLSNDGKITNVTPLDQNYWVYPGSYGEDPCTLVGDPCDSDDTLPGVDSNGITIEMASLHSPPEVNSPNAPDISNALFSFKVNSDCAVSISGNAARGKVVFYDATNEDDGRDVIYTGCGFPPPCPTCAGDLNGDEIKKLVDMYMLRGKLISAYNCTGLYEACKDDPCEFIAGLWDICGDMNGDECLKLVDMYMLRGQLITCYNSSGLYECPCP